MSHSSAFAVVRAVLVLVLWSAAVVHGIAASPAVKLSDDAVTVSSIEPGASVVVFGVAREPIGGIARIATRHQLLVDSDRDAVIRYTPPSGVSPASVWIAVDLASGAVGVAAPGGSARAMRAYGAGEGVPAQAVANRLEVGRQEVSVLLVRPAVGAWVGSVRDGGDADRDQRPDGRMDLDLSRLAPLSLRLGNAPAAMRPGDVFVVLDAERLEYWYGTAPGGGQ